PAELEAGHGLTLDAIPGVYWPIVLVQELFAAYLARQGYRPAAVTVLAAGPGQPLVTASVWHQPVVPEAAKDALALRQVQAAVALLHLGQEELVWPLLRHTPDPRVRTFLIHRLSPLGTDPGTVLRRLEEERDVSIRRAPTPVLGRVWRRPAADVPAADPGGDALADVPRRS
ncbi:MAG: hypothetical protein L0Z62_05740, partial [Gemmataceae bacterium]|nr:hypothetical protein [Gemmataceae bacterium]